MFASRVFLIAALLGLAVLLPQYFLEATIGRAFPPAVTHPEYYYGFVGVGVAWQVAFLIISRDPVRHRSLMLAAVVEKATFGVAMIALFALGRLHAHMLVAGLVDLMFGLLFVVSYVRTGGSM